MFEAYRAFLGAIVLFVIRLNRTEGRLAAATTPDTKTGQQLHHHLGCHKAVTAILPRIRRGAIGR